MSELQINVGAHLQSQGIVLSTDDWIKHVEVMFDDERKEERKAGHEAPIALEDLVLETIKCMTDALPQSIVPINVFHTELVLAHPLLSRHRDDHEVQRLVYRVLGELAAWAAEDVLLHRTRIDLAHIMNLSPENKKKVPLTDLAFALEDQARHELGLDVWKPKT